MGKHIWSDILDYGSDILALVTAQPEIAIAGNAAGGGISGGWKGALLGGGTSFLGSEVLGPVLGQLAGISPLGSAPFSLDPGIGASIGAGLGAVGSGLGASEISKPLAQALGIGGSGTPTQAPAAPTAASTSSPFGGGAAGGPGPAGPSGMNISSSTAPRITPWLQQAL